MTERTERQRQKINTKKEKCNKEAKERRKSRQEHDGEKKGWRRL